KALIIIAGIFFVGLLIIATIYPLRKRKTKAAIKQIHAEAGSIEYASIPSYNKIAIAIDFSVNDPKLIAHAIGQANKKTSFVLIHVVESVSASIYGKEIVRIVKEAKAEMLVIGAHGHTGLKDLIYGETTDAVRHELSIPVLIVNL